MSRPGLRIVAVIVLVLLGAPVTMHVVLHDLQHGHHVEHASGYERATGHGDHEHPVVSPPAPQVPAVVRFARPLAAAPVTPALSQPRMSTALRNVVAFGALRMDDDIGLHSLHSTFLI